MDEVMSSGTARRMALAAQGFADARPAGMVTRRHLNRVLERTRLLQLDSVNVAVRAHYMPVFSRIGPYDQGLLDEAAWSHSTGRPRLLVEYWAHEASLLPVTDWSLFRWRMRHYAGLRGRYWKVMESRPGLAEEVVAAVRELGPITAGALERELAGERAGGRGGWWNRSHTKIACEYLFSIGELSTGTRRGFQRFYDLSERVLPPEVFQAPEIDDDEAARRLIAGSAAALGVATETDLRDYYRLSPARSRQAVAELVEAGALEPVTVRGWARRAYRHHAAKAPRQITGRALLCPFDPLVWERERTERIFDFRYRIEIYVPEAKRVHGYYVFPFLLDGQLVARVDLKADRAAGVLRVPGAFREEHADHRAFELAGIPTDRVAAELAEELRSMAAWLGLSDVVIGERGDLTGALTRALAAGNLDTVTG